MSNSPSVGLGEPDEVIPDEVTCALANRADANLIHRPQELYPEFMNDMETVMIQVGEKMFHLHKHILTLESEFLERVTKTSGHMSVMLKNISSDEFGFYAAMVYRHHMTGASAYLDNCTPGDILRLWRSSRAFENACLMKQAEHALKCELTAWKTSEWARIHKKEGISSFHASLSHFQKAYKYCLAKQVPFDRHLIWACSRMPRKLLAEAMDVLEPTFAVKVAQGFAVQDNLWPTVDLLNSNDPEPITAQQPVCPSMDHAGPSRPEPPRKKRTHAGIVKAEPDQSETGTKF